MKFKKMLTPWKKSYDQPRQHIKKQRHYFANKAPSTQSYSFSSSHVWMYELDYKESWAPKNWCFWTVVLEKTLESPLDSKEIQSVYPKGNQSWIFIGKTDAEAEIPILWSTDVKNWLIWKDPDAGKRLKVGGEGDDRGWDGWMASPNLWTWVWVSSRNWWWTGRAGVLPSMGWQRVRHTWATELNWNSHALNKIQAKVSLLLEKKIHTDVNYIEMSITLQFKKWQPKKWMIKEQKRKKKCTQKSPVRRCNKWRAKISNNTKGCLASRVAQW